jgi:hypothetical protein
VNKRNINLEEDQKMTTVTVIPKETPFNNGVNENNNQKDKPEKFRQMDFKEVAKKRGINLHKFSKLGARAMKDKRNHGYFKKTEG